MQMPTSENTKCVGCPCHLAHLCAGKGAKELLVNVEDCVYILSLSQESKMKKTAKGVHEL